MTIVTCQCGQRFRAAAHLAGQHVACPACGVGLQIPAQPKRSPNRATQSVESKRRGAVIDSIKLTFYRIKGNKMDSADKYESEWLGGSGGRE